MDLESWIIELLTDIKKASLNNENFDLHLESPMVKEIAEQYDEIKWIEIY